VFSWILILLWLCMIFSTAWMKIIKDKLSWNSSNNKEWKEKNWKNFSFNYLFDFYFFFFHSQSSFTYKRQGSSSMSKISNVRVKRNYINTRNFGEVTFFAIEGLALAFLVTQVILQAMKFSWGFNRIVVSQCEIWLILVLSKWG